jgi:hypothetical protein
MMRLLVSFFSFVLFANYAFAEPTAYQKFLKKETPNELYFFAQGGELCLIQSSRLNEIIRQELLKQKIRPAYEIIPQEQEFYLYALLECDIQSVNPITFAYRFGIRFNSRNAATPEAYHVEYTSLGASGDPEVVLQDFRESVNKAVLDYVEANLERF